VTREVGSADRGERARVARDGGVAFERFSRAVDGPMMVLALAMIPLIVVPLVLDLSPATERAVLSIDYVLWAIFAAEYGIKLSLVPNRRWFVAHHIPDLIIVLVPMLRPLRVLRSVRLLRLLRLALLGGFAAKGLREARSILRHRGLNWVLLIVLVLNLIAPQRCWSSSGATQRPTSTAIRMRCGGR